MTFATIYWYRSNALLSRLIRAVTHSHYSHVAIYLNGNVYEAVGDGLFCWTGNDADDRILKAKAFKTVYMENHRAEVMQLWLDKITDKTRKKTNPFLGGYSVAGFLAAGIGFMTGRRFIISREGEYICSGLVATALWRAYFDMPHEPRTMTPEDLADLFQPNDIPGR